jgi:hypothetical protein
MIEPQGTLKIGPSGYKLDPKKLAKTSQSILPYLFSNFYFTEEFEYFDIIKPYLDIPEKPKTLDEITQEFDEKIDRLIVKTKRNFYSYKLTAERKYENKFDRIFDNFEYAVKNGHFPPKLTFTIGDRLYGNYDIVSGSSVESSLVIKQGKTDEGYYTNGNRRYLKYYMPDKPNVIVRFFMRTCLGFFWVDEKDT